VRIAVRARRDQSGGKGVNAMLNAVRKLLASALTRKMMAAVVFALAEHLRERVRYGLSLPRFRGHPRCGREGPRNHRGRKPLKFQQLPAPIEVSPTGFEPELPA